MMTGPESGQRPPWHLDPGDRPPCAQRCRHAAGEVSGVQDLRAAEVSVEAVDRP